MRPRRQQSCSEWETKFFFKKKKHFLYCTSHRSRLCFPLFQPLPATPLLPGCADQQQAFPQDGPPAVLPDVVHLLREAVVPPHLPDPPETAPHPLMDPHEKEIGEQLTSGFAQCQTVILQRWISFIEDDVWCRTKGLHVFFLFFLSEPCPFGYSYAHQTHFLV